MTSLIFSDDIHKKVRQFIIAVLPITSRHDDVINMIPITAFYQQQWKTRYLLLQYRILILETWLSKIC